MFFKFWKKKITANQEYSIQQNVLQKRTDEHFSRQTKAEGAHHH